MVSCVVGHVLSVWRCGEQERELCGIRARQGRAFAFLYHHVPRESRRCLCLAHRESGEVRFHGGMHSTNMGADMLKDEVDNFYLTYTYIFY